MYVLGVGFDPRCLVGLKRFLSLHHPVDPVVGLVELPPPSHVSGEMAQELALSNKSEFEALTSATEVRRVDHQEVHARSNAGTRVAQRMTMATFVAGVGHLAIDISSLPASLYFPMVAAALTSIDRRIQDFPRELQIVACENAAVDAAIQKLGVTEAAVIGGFRSKIAHESEPDGTVIWAPVVGEQSGPALQAIHDFLTPDDVCPVLPFPARNPRRSDDLLLELQRILFDNFLITPGNLIYADERNPFDLYRTLSELQADYHLALRELKPTEVVVSTHSSKLLSVGALLAAYEHGLPIVAAPALDYELDATVLDEVSAFNQLTCAWLAGTPYGEVT